MVLEARDYWVFRALVERIAVSVREIFKVLLVREVCLLVGLGPHLVGSICEPLYLSAKGGPYVRGQTLDEEVVLTCEISGA